MDTQKKGSFSRWSEDSARWYEAASKYTNYHEKLKACIAPYLNDDETCCELACGTGTLARCPAPLTAGYTANDIDPDSLKFCSDSSEGRSDSKSAVSSRGLVPDSGRKIF